MKRGISLVVMLVTIAVILIITSVTVVTGNNIFNNTKKVKFASEISYVEEIVNTYRLNNNGNFPSSKMIYLDSSKIKGNDLNEQFKDENIAEDKSILLYKIDFSMLNPHELTYTDINSDSGDNIYCISPTTGRVYFVQGVKIAGKKYYTLTEDLKKSINYVEDNNVNDGIIFLDDYKGDLKIKIPEKYTDINITSSNGEITVTQGSINEYKLYNVSYINESIITVSYEKDGKSKELKYNVSQVSKDKPEFNISEIKTMVNSKTGKEEKYVTLENVPNNIKVIKYANQVLNESKVRDYFQTGGIEIKKDDVIMIPGTQKYYCIIVYIEDSFGNYNYKEISTASVESYIQSNLVLQLDAINNTRSGYSATTTVWEDLSGNGNDFNLNKFDNTSTSGWQNKSLKFDGVNDYLVSKEIFDFNNTDALTIQFVDLNGELYSNDNSTFQPIFETSVNFNNNNNAFLVNFNEWKNKTICFSTQQNGYNIQYDTDELIAGESMMYTLTFDVKNGHNNYFNMYKNTEKRNITKVAQYSVNLNNFNFNPYPLYIGSRAGTQYFCKMNLASVRIYNRALTEEEIKHNYEIDKIRFGL